MKMRRWKRTLSAVLAGAMVVTSLSAALTAWAAEGDGTEPERDPAVVAVEEKISDWYSTHRSKMYSAKEEDAQARRDARDAYEDVTKDVKALTEAQKLELNINNYVYWLYTVAEDVAHSHNEDTLKNLALGDRVDAVSNLSAEVLEIAGALPASYQAAYDAYHTALTAPSYTAEDGTVFYLPDEAKVNYKDNQTAQNLLNGLNTAVMGLDMAGLEFAGRLRPYVANDTEKVERAGFYFACSTPTTTSYTAEDVFDYLGAYNFFMQQDLLGSGSTPASTFAYRDYVTRGGASGAYTYTWAEGKSAQDYLDAFDAYAASFKTDVVAPSKEALDILLPIIEKFDAYKGVSNAVTLTLNAGYDYYAGTPDTEAVRTALNAVNGLSDTAAVMFDFIGRSIGEFKFAARLQNVYTADTITPELAFTKYSKVDTRSLYYFNSDQKDYLIQLDLQTFIEDVNAADLDTLTDEQIEEFRARYMALGKKFRDEIPADTLAKFKEMIKPAVGEDTFADDLASFTPHAIDKSALKGSVVDVYGGVQYSVDALWNMVKELLPSIAPDVDLTNGLNGLLEQYLYTDSIVEAIFDLYATLSHNDMDLGFMGMTLGKVIGMIVSPSKMADMLEEEKFAGAVEKINAIPAVTDEEKAQGINELDKLAAVDFTASDFGFTNGERAGFVDALLAALRPITSLLAPDAAVAGLIRLGVQMCDYVNADGEYITGVYGNLIPLLEQLGMNVPTTEEYAANYNNVLTETGSKNITADEYLRPVIDALFEDVVDPIAADPLNALIDFLPRLAYVVEDSIAVENEDGSVSYTNILDTQVKAAISQMGGTLGGLAGSLDLTEDAINTMIPDEVTIPLNESTNLTLKLADIDWDVLADCATLSVVPSNSNANAYTLLRTGEAETVFTEVFYYLYTALFGDPTADGGAQLNATMAAVKQLLGEDLSGIIDMMVTPMLSNGKEDAYVNILQLVVGDYQSNVIDQTVTINAGGEVLLAGNKLTSGTIKAMNGIALDYMIRATEADYVIGSVAVGGGTAAEAAGQLYYLLNAVVGADRAVDVSFQYNGDYNVTVKVGENGSADAESMSVHAGATVEITFTANDGYVIDALTVNGEAVEAAAGQKTYVWTTGVYGDMVVEATFAEEPTETDPTDPTEPTEPTDPTDPTEPTNPTEPTEPSEPTTGDDDDTQTPDTTVLAGGDNTQGGDSNVETGDAALAAVAGAALLAAGAVIVLTKKKK